MKYLYSILLLLVLTGCTNDTESLQNQVTDLNSQIAEITSENEQLNIWITELESNIKLSDKELSLRDIEILEWKQEVSSQVLTIADLEDQLSLLQEKHDALTDKYDYLKSISDFNDETEFRKEVLDHYIVDPLMDVYTNNTDLKEHLESILIDDRTYFVPADSKKGFQYPYLLFLPTETYQEDNEQYNRYLFVYPQNNDFSSDLLDGIMSYDPDERDGFYTLADELWSPVLVPLFPSITLKHKTDLDVLDMQSLSRGSILAGQTEESDYARTDTETVLPESSYDTLLRVDQQLNGMIIDAMDQLDTFGYQLNDQVMMFGEARGGLFVERFAFMYPELVKAYFASNAIITPVPTITYYGTSLTFPLGTADYQDLFGQSFDLTAYNNIAKINMMSDDAVDPLNIVLDSRVLTKIQNAYESIDDFDLYWESVSDLFFEHGGEALFVVNNLGEGITTDLDYRLVKEFFQMNRDTTTPLYPTGIPYGSYSMRTN